MKAIALHLKMDDYPFFIHHFQLSILHFQLFILNWQGEVFAFDFTGEIIQFSLCNYEIMNRFEDIRLRDIKLIIGIFNFKLCAATFFEPDCGQIIGFLGQADIPLLSIDNISNPLNIH